jgi:hypothetical protein
LGSSRPLEEIRNRNRAVALSKSSRELRELWEEKVWNRTRQLDER